MQSFIFNGIFELIVQVVCCCISANTVFTLRIRCLIVIWQANLLQEMQTDHGTVCSQWVSCCDFTSVRFKLQWWWMHACIWIDVC